MVIDAHLWVSSNNEAYFSLICLNLHFALPGGVGVTGPVGYSYLLEPPRRFSYSAMSAGGAGPGAIGRRKSGSESSRIFSNYPMGGSFGHDDYFIETEDELENEEYMQQDAHDEQEQLHKRTDSTRSKPGFLSVPMAVSGRVVVDSSQPGPTL